MGLVLFVWFAAGLLAGAIVDGACLLGGLLVLRKSGKERERTGTVASLGGIAAAVLCALAVPLLPYRDAEPGSDFGAMSFNLLLRGAGYGAVPGLGFLVGAMLTLLCPRRRDGTPRSR